MCLPVILFLLIIPDRSLSQTCDTPYLYEEYKEKFDSDLNELKKFQDERGKWYTYKCLACYDKTPPFTVTTINMEETARTLVKYVDKLIYQIVENPSMLTHDDYIPAFEKTCFNSHLTKNFMEKLRELLNQSKFESAWSIKFSCPLGLLYDIACSFASCTNTRCTVNGEECDQEEEHSCDGSPPISLKPFCKDEFEGFIRSCFFDTSEYKQSASKLVATLNGSLDNSNCQPLNPIYHGLTSLQALEKGIITADCSEANETVTLKCFKEGTYVSSGLTWYDDNGEVSFASGSTWTIHQSNLSNYGLISCRENGTHVAQITSTDLITLYKAVVDEDVEDPSEDSGRPIDRSYFYKTEGAKTWLLDGYASFSGMDAFDNEVRLANNVGYLCVPTVSVMGRLTPICGDHWNAAAAQVFCRDAGLQRGENWTAAYVGVIRSSENKKTGNQFYKHYMRNVKCNGSEKKLIWCEHDGWYLQTDCSHDAVVICSNNTQPPVPDPGSGPDPVVIIIVIIVATMAFIIVGIVLCCLFNRNIHHCEYIKLKDLKNLFNWRNVDKEPASDIQSYTTVITSLTMEPSNESISTSSTCSFMYNRGSVQFNQSLPCPPIPEGAEEEGGVVVKRLNAPETKEWVLLYQFYENGHGGMFQVCKSFEEVSGETRDNMMTEKFYLSNVNHPNVVKCAHKPMSVNFNNQDHISFFMEYLVLGSLDKYLTTRADETQRCNGHLLTVDNATSIIVGACRALHFVHSEGYVHADISSDNFFVFINPAGRVDVKLGDFGSFYKPVGPPWQYREVRRTQLYTAPELLVEEPKNRDGQPVVIDPFKNDVWGLGLVLWEVLSWVSCNARNSSDDNRLIRMASNAVNIVSRLRDPDKFDYDGCRRHVHVALLAKINNHNSSVKTNRPEKLLMKNFYSEYYPHNIGYPVFHITVNDTFNWPITNILKKCLATDPEFRPTMGEVLRYLIEHSCNSSTLSPYRGDIESDLTNNSNTLIVEDAADDELSSLQLPPTVQPLGQLYKH